MAKGRKGRAAKPKGKKKPEPVSIHDSLIKTIQSLPKKSDYVFTDEDGNPFPLKPGHTWVNVYTPSSSFYEKPEGSGSWKAVYSPTE